MLLRTHTAVGLVAALYFLPHVVNKVIFVPIVLLASALPDIDTGYSNIGKHKIFRPVQMFSSHRGIFHTYTMCIAISVLLALFYPIFALPFFLGYSFHLILDSFTPKGIRPFWPFRVRVEGRIKTGGPIDTTIFYVCLIFAAALLINMVL